MKKSIIFLALGSVIVLVLWIIISPVFNHGINKDVLVGIKNGMSVNEVIEIVGNDPVDINYEGNIHKFNIYYYEGMDGIVQFYFVNDKLTSFRSY